MRRLVALCLFSLACTAGCSLDFGNTDQNNDQQGDDDNTTPPDLPGDAYRQCVLDTLSQCDAWDLPPNACTDLIAQNCNDTLPCDPNTMDPTGQCPPPCDPTTDPMGCPPPPDDCFQTVFDECVASGVDPQECVLRADQVCNPQCMPGDPNCPPPCDPTNPDGSCPCDPNTMDPTGQCPPPPPPCDPTDPNSMCPPCDPTSGQGCDCWSLVFGQCISEGLPQDECAARADQVCYPQPCTDPNDPNCYPCDPTDPNGMCPCDPATGMCPPPPCTDPMDPNCYPPPPPPCTDPMDPNCWPPTCTDPTDPNCYPQPPQPPPCDPMDPNCVYPDGMYRQG